MAAILAAGDGALLCYESSAARSELRHREKIIEVSIPRSRRCRVDDFAVHRRHSGVFVGTVWIDGIPVTSPIRTIVDLASRTRSRAEVATLINKADALDLIDPEALRTGLDRFKGEPGAPLVRDVLDRATFVLTDSELERRFLPLARAVGLPTPETQVQLNGVRVDFFWPELGLVVETDGLRYHRTPTQQARDRRRDNVHAVAGLTPLRFTHAEVRYEPGYVQATLATAARRLRPGA
jgi:very-short-patch-repair endonuclease